MGMWFMNLKSVVSGYFVLMVCVYSSFNCDLYLGKDW